jgi:hypothetical protein
MSDHAPTYRLGPDFYDKLGAFVDHTITAGFEQFAAEFSQLDTYVASALACEHAENRLRRTPKEKYLLEALAFCIYDRHNRAAFNAARDTLIVLPDCLSLHNPDCIKTDEPWGDRCQQCTTDCQAAQVTYLAEAYGIPVVFSKRKLAEQIEHYAGQSGSLSVIGIACLMMLAEGMRTAHEVGVPARGVLLSFSGCEHWQDRPCASAFPLERLKAILEEKYGQRT